MKTAEAAADEIVALARQKAGWKERTPDGGPEARKVGKTGVGVTVKCCRM